VDGGPTTIASRTLTRLFDLKTFLRLNVSTLMLVLTVFIMLCCLWSLLVYFHFVCYTCTAAYFATFGCFSSKQFNAPMK